MSKTHTQSALLQQQTVDMVENVFHQPSLFSIYQIYPTNHVCSLDIGLDKLLYSAALSLPSSKQTNISGKITVVDFMCEDSLSDEGDSETPEEATVRAIDALIKHYKAENIFCFTN